MYIISEITNLVLKNTKKLLWNNINNIINIFVETDIVFHSLMYSSKYIYTYFLTI